MTFPCYSKYKASGFIWLGDVPESWALKRLGHYFDERRERASDTEFEPLSVTKHGIVPRLESAAKTQDGDNRKKVLAGDFVINSRSDRKGSSGLSPLDGSVSLICTVLIPIGLHGPFIHHLFRSELFQEEYYRWGKGIVADLWSTNFSDMKNIVLGVPSEVEQTQIARFLDHETARIDALIEEQQRLIELLKEKRQAVISHAVTKGLDSTVPMKDSGVEWLGDVPAHWVVCATRRVIRFIEQGWSPECESYPAEEDGWGVLKAGCVNRGFFDASENKTLPSSLNPIPEYEVRAGDILMSRASGSPELVGSTALLGQVRERLMLSDKIFRIHLEEKVSNQFFVWVMNAQFMRSQIEQALSGGNGLANNLPQSSLLAFWLAIPPEHEQCAIAELINEQTGRIDELIVEGDVAVELLQERRSALISAAVTGKIDVRGWQPPANVPIPELVQEAV
ncbi:restriction endonuclease subunit S [Pseudomonas brenneri]|uniref:restriction endonuclease subunit S n=1 Tax=Pseudomonas TaxID=286 RepID=UPI000653150D|nr:restriction endonuclease subunit S [Pseudomonas lundensis]KMM87705.1 hypothetical protein TU74_16200 [Pseudomonas lundensis]NNA21299.1 restriction endonuclease subunit S [Pseudomonas lundensis]